MSVGKKVLLGCGGLVVLLLVLAWVYGERVVMLFTMSNTDPSGETAVRRIDAGPEREKQELRVFIDPRDGGR